MRPLAVLALGLACAVSPALVSAASPWGAATPNSRTDPYKNFKFRVFLDQRPVATVAEVTGMGVEADVAEYRGQPSNHALRPPGVRKYGDITLKRGVTNSADLWTWCQSVRSGRSAATMRDVEIQAFDQAGQVLESWRLQTCRPTKYEGPALGGNGGDTAIEELVLSCESISLVRP